MSQSWIIFYKSLTWKLPLGLSKSDWLTEETRNRELIYSSQKATKIFGRKVVEKWSMPKHGASTKFTGGTVTKKNGWWRHLNITILELYLTTQGTGSERPNSRKAHTRKAHTRKAHFIRVQKGPLLDTRKAHFLYLTGKVHK